jgi:UDP-N-acetylglucosamine acyltransferase
VLGNNVKVLSHAVISGATKIGDNCTICPFSSIGVDPQDLKFRHEPSRLEIGCNTTVRENVTISIGTRGGGMLTSIGNDCLIMAYCHIAHDCFVGNGVVLANGVNLSGHVVIEDRAIIGGLSAVKQFVRIGTHAMVGGCTGVDRDVIPYGLVRGKRETTIRGLNVIGLKRHGFSSDCIKEMMLAFEDLFLDVDDESLLEERMAEVKNRYSSNQHVMKIIDFMHIKSKNSLCTATPIDLD